MKTIKSKILIILLLVISMILALNGKVLGTDSSSNPKYVGITELRSGGLGYAIGDPNSGGAKIWNVVEYQSASSNSYSENNIYCLKAGAGFENVDEKVVYNVFYDMKTEKDAIRNQNNILKGLVDGTIQLDGGGTISQYSGILAVLDLFYYDGISDESYKDNLLNAAGIHSSAYKYHLTDDDIEAVQQAALWYFTNYGENPDVYDQTGNSDSGWLYYTDRGVSYSSLADYNLGEREGQQRQIQAEILYKYLVKTAIEKAPEYDNLSSTTTAPIQLDTKALSYEIQGSRTIIGPIHITQNNIKAYDLEFITKINDTATEDYILLDQNKSQVSNGTTIEDLIGKDFYISLPVEKTLKSTISIEVNITYNEMKFKLWASSTGPNEQPILIPEKEEITVPGKLEIEIPDLKGSYELEIVKQDGKTGAKLAGAVFNVNGENKTATNASGIVNIGTFQITDTSTPDTYTITETSGPEGYKKFDGTIELSVAKKIENGTYVVDTDNTTMVVKDSEGTQITQNIPVTIDKTTGKITITVDNEKVEGNYELEIVKQDGETGAKLSGAVFNVNGENKTATNASGIVNIGTFQITDTSTPDTYTITETSGPEGYKKFDGTIELSVAKKIENGTYVVDTDNTTMVVKDSEGTQITQNIPVTIDKTTGKITITVDNEKIEGNYVVEIVKKEKGTDIALPGAIFNVNGEDKTATNSNGILSLGTIEITEIDTPDTYTITETSSPDGYNKFDGSIELSVAKKLENGAYVVDTDNTTMVVKDSTGATITENVPVTIDKTTGRITITVDNEKIVGDYELEIVKVDSKTGAKLSGAVFNVNGEDKTATNTDGVLNLGTTQITGTETKDSYIIKETTSPDTYNKFDGTIELDVAKKEENGKYVIDTENTTMVVKDSTGAEITQNIPVTIDKTTGKITITVENVKKEFDLALRKFIVAVSRDENIEEDEYLRNEDGSYSRAPVVDASELNTVDEDGNKITTATYNHTKEPVEVRKGDTVIYTIRVYNEGEIAGYAQTITDYLPDELEFLPDHEINQKYEWTIEGNRVTTDYLSKEKETEERENLIEAFDETRVNEEEPLYYKEVQIACKVKDTARADWKITNLAQITEDADKNGDETDDRDSTPDGGFEEPEGEDRPTYKDDETGEYIPGQEDDDDFEKVIVKEFDLALRKFIIAVSNDETIEEDEYLKNADGSYTREPVVDTSLLNTEDEEGNLITTAIYNHTKEPVLVQKNDIVIYMLRVYNEGDIDGYAAEIKDHLPPYLEYVDGEFNNQYGWEVSEDGRTLTTRYLENSLINKPVINEDGAYELSYQEVPVMCRVIESAPTNENITNIADITEYQDDEKEEAIDRDSESDNVELPNDENLPGYKGDETGEYIPGQQDDDDFEKVIVKEFDLALRKWVTEAIVIENGKETVTATGHQPYDDPEEIVKVELHRKKLNQVTVKFRYSIRVTNEGDIPGYVKEITDYVPEGLRFDPADNPGWTDEGNNIISTRLTEDILLQPGEYTEVEVVLTWINSENNMGVMTNIAEISEDDNEYDIPDRDSTPDNQKEGEDDIDDAPVMISISTGAARTYFMLGGIVLITIAGGVFLIKKFVI